MDKEKKTLKSPLSEKSYNECEEWVAKIAGEAQKSLAKEVLSIIESIQPALQESVDKIVVEQIKLIDLKKFLNELLK